MEELERHSWRQLHGRKSPVNSHSTAVHRKRRTLSRGYNFWAMDGFGDVRRGGIAVNQLPTVIMEKCQTKGKWIEISS